MTLEKVELPVSAEEMAADGGDAGLIGYLVRDVHRAFTRSLQDRISLHGVTMGQWFFLRALWEEDGLTQRELSQRVGMMEPTTVTALNSMERRGLVERVRNKTDRRKVNIFLSEKGRRLEEVLQPAARQVNLDAVRGMAPEAVQVVMGALKAMLANLAPDEDDGSYTLEDEAG